MKHVLIKLTPEGLKNLYIFLGRADLKGHQERMAMNEIELAIMSAKEEEEIDQDISPVE